MKKIFYSLFLSLSLLSSLAADITSEVSNFIHLNCSFEPAMTRKAKRPTKGERPEDRGQTRPHLPISQGLSLNWSGYASADNLTNPTSGSVSSVSGIWLVPQLASTTNTTYCSFWVGIDGYASNSVEQIGTEHDWSNGQQYNYAWFEIYPNPAYQIIGFPVNAGDLIQGEVDYIGNNQFKLTLINYTQSVYTIIPYSYTVSSNAARNSVEWVVEAPSTSFGALPLANFQTATFMNCRTTINNVSGGIQSLNWQADPLTMITSTGTVKAIPSAISQNNESFSVDWEHE